MPKCGTMGQKLDFALQVVKLLKRMQEIFLCLMFCSSDPTA